MFDPSVPNRCTCGQPDCTARIVDGQRIRVITEPTTAVAFVHPEDVVDCLNAVLRQVLDSHGPYAAAALPLLVAVGQFVTDWISDPQHHVPPEHTFTPGPFPDEALSRLLDELAAGNTEQLEQALQHILDQG